MTVGTVPLLLVALAVFVLLQRMGSEARSGTEHLAKDDLQHVADLVYGSVAVYSDALRDQTRQTLSVAADALKRRGGASVSASHPVAWQAKNQLDNAVTPVTLPGVTVGGAWLGQQTSADVRVDVVDEVRDIVGARCTIFQRMNPAGDMLRVATNVLKDGKRAIGTYIPAVEPGGTRNAVVAAVLDRQTFVGRAFVVDGWYVTAYQPIVAGGDVVGMLFVGLPEQQAVSRLLKDIGSIKVGETGRVLLFNASGASAGKWLLSPDGKDEGKVALDAKDADGQPFVKAMVDTALALPPGTSGDARFRLRDGGPEHVVRLRYFKPWDYVIGVAIPQDEMYEMADRISRMSSAALWTLGVIVSLSGGLAGIVWLVTARRLTRQVRPLVAQLAAAASQVTTAASALAENSDLLAKGASEQAASSQVASDSLAEMDGLTRKNADVARQAAGIARTGRAAADAGVTAMDRLSGAMGDIQASGGNVAKIARAIDDLAFQTQLLALNAAVEAARAGDAGLGFAVVAGEVRTLAQRSAEAAREATSHVEQAIASSQKGTELTRDLQGGLTELVTVVRGLGDSVNAIEGHSRQQQKGISHLNGEVGRMSELGRANAAEAEESAAASQEMSAQAAVLNDVARQLDELFHGGSREATDRRAATMNRLTVVRGERRRGEAA